MTESALTVVANHPDRFTAELSRGYLEANGVPAMTLADDDGGMDPLGSRAIGVRVLVRDEDASRARALLSTLDQEG